MTVKEKAEELVDKMYHSDNCHTKNFDPSGGYMDEKISKRCA